MNIQYIYCPKCGGIIEYRRRELYLHSEHIIPVLPECKECGQMYQVEITEDLKIKLHEARL